MDDYEDLDRYDGAPRHDMWVDFDYNENTGNLTDLLEDPDDNMYYDED